MEINWRFEPGTWRKWSSFSDHENRVNIRNCITDTLENNASEGNVTIDHMYRALYHSQPSLHQRYLYFKIVKITDKIMIVELCKIW